MQSKRIRISGDDNYTVSALSDGWFEPMRQRKWELCFPGK
jgi:hypothetical protein